MSGARQPERDHDVPFVGLILAGGEGRRYGGPKAFARLPDGRTFLAACTDALTAAGARPVAATVPLRHAGHEIAGLRQIPLPQPGLDMLRSLEWGLRHLASDAVWELVVVLPVDHPLVGPDAIWELVRARAAVAVPSYDGRQGHPVCLDREVALRIARGHHGAGTLRDILTSVGPTVVPVADPGVIANCNTPGALRAALDNHTL